MFSPETAVKFFEALKGQGGYRWGLDPFGRTKKKLREFLNGFFVDSLKEVGKTKKGRMVVFLRKKLVGSIASW